MRSRERAALALFAGVATLVGLGPISRAEAAERKFALSVLHFNVQYVAGGLNGFFPTPDPLIDLDEREVEDAIVRESFEPVLDMLLAHPTWGSNIELQGYMLDVMAARHPDVLDKLRELAVSRQIEVVSFHYSDQLFLAYPREDWERSRALNDATFAKHGLPRAKTVFCQEGQAGPGLAGAMAGAGYETLVFPKNLWGYQHGDRGPVLPIYRFGDVKMVTSRGTTWQEGDESVQVEWWFVDDGELLATGDFDPYLAEHFKKDPEAIAEAEASLAALEAQGFEIATVAEYVAAIDGVVPLADPPPLLDGTWQPDSTDGIHRWLGGYGLWWADERDNDVRTLGASAHRELLAAETAAAVAGLEARDDLDGAWRLLVLGQVTDTTGINPFRGEIEYGLAHFSEALRIARDVIVRAKALAGDAAVAIDTAAGTMVAAGPPAPAGEPADAPIELSIESGDREHVASWLKHDDAHHEVRVRFGRGDERSLSVVFPGEPGDIVYTPGLADAPVHVPRDAFVFDHFELALSDGLIGLAPSRFVIKDQAHVHIGAAVRTTTGDVRFHDDTAPAQEETTWVFHLVLGGEADAAALARAINVTPEVRR